MLVKTKNIEIRFDRLGIKLGDKIIVKFGYGKVAHLVKDPGLKLKVYNYGRKFHYYLETYIERWEYEGSENFTVYGTINVLGDKYLYRNDVLADIENNNNINIERVSKETSD